ncbi:hypothetical protein A4X09_0g1932 [Tilletia walkeri]|uniref:SAC3/GANP/THP3 conserved domain-containing protein n=1 Tax=Tilletia walkeri TaxID=117179 RepID=A0A8X7T6A3_9BASI|nr:hypothetical protein A4X09_0g1932 [Tilletia walkeri]
MDDAPKLVLAMSGGRGREIRAASRGAARGSRGGARGRATFRNRSATFTRGSLATSALKEAGDSEAEDMTPAHQNGFSSSFGAPAFTPALELLIQPGPSAVITQPQVTAAGMGASLSTSAPVFRPTPRSTLSLAVMKARHPTPPLEENRFFEMKAERDELRKRYIREGILPDPLKPQQLSEAAELRGTCMRMCPEFECHEREFQKELDRLELRLDTPPGTGARVDKRLAVKIYRRPAAGREIPLPEEIRPPDVLKRTLDYLTSVLLPRDITSSNFALVQPFLWNRTRAIRQDFIVQGETGALAIECHERIARLHILCLHARGGPGADKWSEQQELEQLRKTLRSLIEFYDDRRQAVLSASGAPAVAPNEAEFRAYNLLLHLRDPETLREVELLPTSVFLSPQVQVALRLRTCAQRSNNIERRGQPMNEEATLNFFTAFFKEVDRLPVGSGYLLACLAENVFTDIRRGAIKAMCHAYAERLPPTFDYVRRSLGLGSEYSDEDVVGVLGTMGIEVFADGAGVRRAKAHRGVAILEDKPLPHAPEFSVMIETKRGDFTNAEIVDGIASNAASLIEVTIPPFVGFNPHLPQDGAGTAPARARPLAPIPAVAATPSVARESSSTFAPKPAFSQPIPPAAAAFPSAVQNGVRQQIGTSSFPSAFNVPVEPVQSVSVSAFGQPSKALPVAGPSTSMAFPVPAQVKAVQPSFSFASATRSIMTQSPAPKIPSAAPPSVIIPARAARMGMLSPAATFPGPQPAVKTPLKSPVQISTSYSFGTPASDRVLAAVPLSAKSLIRPRLSDGAVAAVVPAVVAVEVDQGPSAEELAKAARQEARRVCLDVLQERLTDKIMSELLGGQNTSRSSYTGPVTVIKEQPLTMSLAQEALADQLELRIVQSWAMDRWRNKLRRIRRDEANAKRLKSLLRLASDRSMDSSSFFLASKAPFATKASRSANGGYSSILGAHRSLSMIRSHHDDIDDYSMEEVASDALLEAKARRAQLWATGEFFNGICNHIRAIPGSRVLRDFSIQEWVAVIALASDDPSNATSGWLRQKLGLAGASNGLGTHVVTTTVKREDESQLRVSAIETSSLEPEHLPNVGMLVFELSKHVLDMDNSQRRSRIDARDLRKLIDIMANLPLKDSRLLPGLVLINWEIEAPEAELLHQIQEAIRSDPRLGKSDYFPNRICVLMAGELQDVEAVTDAFLAVVRRAIPAIELHPLQRVLALRRALTLRDMTSRIFRPLSDALVAVSESLQTEWLPSGKLAEMAQVGDINVAVQTAFSTIVALSNYGLRSLLRLSEHIVDETELLEDLNLPVPASPSNDSTTVSNLAFRLALAELAAPALRDNDGAAVLRCLLEQQQAQGDSFHWRLYFSEVISVLINRAQDTFISCRVDIDVEAEMDKVATQMDAWAHQLLTEIHHAVSVQRAARLKRNRSPTETHSFSEAPDAKKLKAPAQTQITRDNIEVTSSSPANSLRAMLARARQLVE